MAETILYYDCFAGISGDMNLAALVAAGVPREHLNGELDKLRLAGWRLRLTEDSRGGIHGLRLDVDVEAEPAAAGAAGGHHHRRSHADITGLIESSTLSATVKDTALRIFQVLAEAEAAVHRVPVGSVHFHEVGAVDSIVDIVGAAICLEHLHPDRILCSTVTLGSGWVRAQHGMLPVPAPATALILAGVPVRAGVVPFEMTTPTGAAILKSCVTEFTDEPCFVIDGVAYGIGHRETEIPNVLRVFLAHAVQGAKPEEEAVLLECNLDDMTPEVAAYTSEALLAAGAADVFMTPIVMKKGRAAVQLSVLCAAQTQEQLARLILRETTTFGLRRTRVHKTALERKVEAVQTTLGEVRVKTAYLEGKALKVKPEYEDCRRIARDTGMTLREVMDALARELGEARDA